jgi:hypothetical protein
MPLSGALLTLPSVGVIDSCASFSAAPPELSSLPEPERGEDGRGVSKGHCRQL